MPQKIAAQTSPLRVRARALLCLAALFAAALFAGQPLSVSHGQENNNRQQSSGAKPKPKLGNLRTSDTAKGSEVTITATETLNNYRAYRSGDRYYVVIPNAEAGSVRGGARGRGFDESRVEKRGDDVVLSFRLPPGTKPRVQQRFNRLDVVFEAGEGQAQSNTSSDPGRGQTSDTRNPTTTPTQQQQQTTQPAQQRDANAETATPPTRVSGTHPIQQQQAEQPTGGMSSSTAATQGAQPTPDAAPTAEPQTVATEATPAAVTQVADARQPESAREPVKITNDQQPAQTGTTIAAALRNNWPIALIAALLLVGLGLFLATRRSSATKAEQSPAALAEIEDKRTIEDERPATIEEPKLAAFEPVAPVKVAPATFAPPVVVAPPVESEEVEPAAAETEEETTKVTPSVARASKPSKAERKKKKRGKKGQRAATETIAAAVPSVAQESKEEPAEEAAPISFVELEAPAFEEESAGDVVEAAPPVEAEPVKEVPAAPTSVEEIAPAEDETVVAPTVSEEVAEEDVAPVAFVGQEVAEPEAIESETTEPEIEEPTAESVVEETPAHELTFEEAAAEDSLVEEVIFKDSAVEIKPVEEVEETPPPVNEIVEIQSPSETAADFAAEVSEEPTPVIEEPAAPVLEVPSVPAIEAEEPQAEMETPAIAAFEPEEQSTTAAEPFVEPVAPVLTEITPVVELDADEIQVETSRLLNGEQYDRRLASVSDPVMRQMIASELLAALAGRNVERRERARAAFIEHGYFSETEGELHGAATPAERASAARSLGLVGERKATPHLIAALEDEASDVRRAAVEALASLRDPSAVEPLRALLEREQKERIKLPRKLIQHAIEVCAEGPAEDAPQASLTFAAQEITPQVEVPVEPARQTETSPVEAAAFETPTIETSVVAEDATLEVAPVEEAPAQSVAVEHGSGAATFEPTAEALTTEAEELPQPAPQIVAEAPADSSWEPIEAPVAEDVPPTFTHTVEFEAETPATHVDAEALTPESFVQETVTEVSAEEKEVPAVDTFLTQEEDDETPTLVREEPAFETHRSEPVNGAGAAPPAGFETTQTRAAEEWVELDMLDAVTPTDASRTVEASAPLEVKSEEVEHVEASIIEEAPAQDSTREIAPIIEGEEKVRAAGTTRHAVDSKGITTFSADELSAVPKAIQLRLASDEPEERATAIKDLALVNSDDAFRVICQGFDDPSAEVRSSAARSLYNMDTDRAEAFTRALREASPQRRRNIGAAIASSGLAAEALSRLTGESREKTYDSFSLLFLMAKAGEVQPLIKAIEAHPDTEVRLAVVKLLALSGQKEILPAFRRLAVRGTLPQDVRAAVMEAIYQITSQSPAA